MHSHAYGISQNLDTKDYIIVLQILYIVKNVVNNIIMQNMNSVIYVKEVL